MFLNMTTDAKFSRPAYLAPKPFAVIRVDARGNIETVATAGNVSAAHDLLNAQVRRPGCSYFIEVRGAK